jgi:5'-3' exonuclease
VVAVDLSSILYPIYMTSADNAELNHVANATAAKVHQLALGEGERRVVVCCDSPGQTFRHELDPSYKANRRDKDASLLHQLQLAQDLLRADGWPVWAVPGFEADDIIASLVAQLPPTTSVLIVSGDKDLLQLVTDRVKVKTPRQGEVYDEAAAFEKFGVMPYQMRDYLALVGDASDNIQGLKGCGPVRAVQILKAWKSLDDMYVDLDRGVARGLTPAIVQALVGFKLRLPLVRALIALRTDVKLPIAELEKPPASRPTPPPPEEEASAPVAPPVVQTPNGGELTITFPEAPPVSDAAVLKPLPPLPTTTELARVATNVVDVEFERKFEPNTMTQATWLAQAAFDSRLWGGSYTTWQALLMTFLAGRELGLTVFASVRAVHIIEGKATLSADLLRAMVLRSGLAEYFRCTERTAERATFATKRVGDPEIALTFTLAEGRQAWFGDNPSDGARQKAWSASAWAKNPADMCVARASAKLARLVYPDVVHGLYAPEELEHGR